MATEQPVRMGVENLLHNCVVVAKGESILLLNEKGGVDADLVALMEEAIAAAGGAAYSLWVEPLTGIRELPAVVGSAVVAADKLVLNAGLNRVVLLEHLRASDRPDLIRINNRARAADAISTEHATFNWRLVMALATRTEQVTAAASTWSITSPHGTDMRGRVASGSEVADAFFAQDTGTGRTERVFPGEVYAPVGSADANGVIAFDHPGFADKERFGNPMMLTVTDSVLTDIAWREEPARPGQRDDATGNTVWTREQLVALLEANAEKYGSDRAYVVDSWHGGMHPKAVKRGGQQSNQDTMHFHVGRVPAAVSAYVSDQTIELDGVPFWANGHSALLDEPEIKAMAAEYGASI